jgi:ribonuclease BN (tRNA processing enzyme)
MKKSKPKTKHRPLDKAAGRKTKSKAHPKKKRAAPATSPKTKRKNTKRDKDPSKSVLEAQAPATKKRVGYSHLVLLGTGTPGPDPRRSGPALAIVVNDQPYIVDFGPGVVRRSVEAYEKGVRGLDTWRLNRAFLTHLHSDHTAGYPDLILTPWVMGRDEPLQVFGPPGLNAMTDHILKAYRADIDQRLHGLEPANDVGCQVIATEVHPGLIYEDDHVEVHAFEVWHGDNWTCYGFKFICPDRTIVVSGDTGMHANVEKAAMGCDVLVHEVCSAEGVSWRSEPWQKYHSTYHTLGPELGEICKKANPGLVVLTHQLHQGVSDADLLREIREIYSGPVVSGKDLDIF